MKSLYYQASNHHLSPAWPLLQMSARDRQVSEKLNKGFYPLSVNNFHDCKKYPPTTRILKVLENYQNCMLYRPPDSSSMTSIHRLFLYLDKASVNCSQIMIVAVLN